MQVWGGKIKFAKDERENDCGTPTRDGKTSPVQSLISGAGLTPEQFDYLEKVVQPLLAKMVQEAVISTPNQVAAFFVQWLLVYLSVPRSLSEPICSFLKTPKQAKQRGGSLQGQRLDRCDVSVQTEALDVPSVAALKEEDDDEDEAEDAFEPVAPTTSMSSSARPGRAHSILKRMDSSSLDTPPSRSGGSRKVSISVMKHAEEGAKRDSLGMTKKKIMRSRAVSIFVPPPDVPHEDIVACVRCVPLFKTLSDEDVEKIAHIVQIRTFGPEEDIVRVGDKHCQLHMIYSGEGRVSVPTVKGTLKHGDSFGEHALVKCHLAATSTVSNQGGGDKRLVTLAVDHKEFAELGLMNKLKQRREGVAASNFIPRSGECTSRKGRRNTPAKLSVNLPRGSKDPEAAKDGFKDPEERALILQAIRSNSHFTDWLALSEEQMDRMCDMMRPTAVPNGTNVIQKGATGNTFYIVSDGILQVVIGDEQTVPQGATEIDAGATENGGGLGRIRAGDSFGELALLYNCPRKATVRAVRECRLWVLDRSGFRTVMRLKSDSRIAEYKKLVNMVTLLAENLNEDEKETLADALEEAFFVKDEEIVRQGDDGDTFFLVFEGTCEVFVNGLSKGILEKGSYFGERALLNNEPRAATVVCTSEASTLLSLDSHSFSLLLGEALQVAIDEDGEATVTSERNNPRISVRASVVTQVGLIDRLMAESGVQESSLHNKVPWENLEAVGALGYGAFGIVTLQRDRETGKSYALKALSKGYIRRESLQQHVLSEKKTMQMLDSEFTILMHCTYRCPQYVYFLLEPALGGELYNVFSEHEEFFGSEKHARFYSICCSLGLEHLHSRKIIYRDLKLENVLLYNDGYALLTDLGLAKVVIGKTYTVCGTADYFAPETLRQVGHNRAVDWWAFGVLMFTLMAGRSPFDAENVMAIYRNIIKGFKKEQFPETFSSDLVDLIKSICRKKPEERLPMAPGGAKNLEQHAWYQGIQFEVIEKRMMKAPYVPDAPDYVTMGEKLKNFPPPDVEFVQNDDATDDGWDLEFG